MINILKKFNISSYTYIFILICFLCGYIKNIIIIYFICIIHELGHVFFIKLFNYKINEINIYPFGGYTIIDQDINSPINKDIIITLGGIIFQVILYFIIKTGFFNNITSLINYYNRLIFLFNILPIIPLDGSKLLKLILEKYISFNNSFIIYIIISFISLFIFILINYIYKVDNYFIILFLVFKLITEIRNYKYIYNRFLLERYLNNYKYYKIDNKTKDIKELKKEVLHYFKIDNKYINEKRMIEDKLYCK